MQTDYAVMASTKTNEIASFIFYLPFSNFAIMVKDVIFSFASAALNMLNFLFRIMVPVVALFYKLNIERLI